MTSFYHLCRTCSFTWTLGPCRFPCAIEIPFAHPSWPFTLSFTIGTLHRFFSLTPRLSQSHCPACSHLFSFTSTSCLAGHSPVCSNPPEPPPPPHPCIPLKQIWPLITKSSGLVSVPIFSPYSCLPHPASVSSGFRAFPRLSWVECPSEPAVSCQALLVSIIPF